MADENTAALEAMAASVAAKVEEETAATKTDTPPADAITPDFVAKCAGFAEKGDECSIVLALEECDEVRHYGAAARPACNTTS